MWGHLAGGNLHPSTLPKNAEETRAGFEALLELADEAPRRGGCPLSEHGVGRNPVKQELLGRFLGDEAIEQMRAVNRVLDPQWRFAPGLLFPAETRIAADRGTAGSRDHGDSGEGIDPGPRGA